MQLKALSMQNEQEIMHAIQDAFAVAPWNDNWNDKTVFHLYLRDIIGNADSVALGLYDGDELIGVALGRLKHWFDGIELCLDDFGIKTAYQGKGAGSQFLQSIHAYAHARHYKSISLRTNRTAPAYQFYLKNGFVESEHQVFFSMNCN